MGSPVLNLLDSPVVQVEKLSAFVRAAWEKDHPGVPPRRSDLQDIGNELRKGKGLHYLAEQAVKGANERPDPINFLFVDGIRNTGEVRWLRDTFGYRFYLFAVDAREEERWRRARRNYEDNDLKELDYQQDDDRDRDEEIPHGQQVQLCVDEADVLIVNDEHLSPGARPRRLGERVAGYIRLVAGLDIRYPTDDETIMNIAYAASNSTRCLKRQVGSVIVSPEGEPISIGFNENPIGTEPCVIAYSECYRDLVRNNHFTAFDQKGIRCPHCGEKIGLLVGPPWKCNNEVCQKDLSKIFFPDRAMAWCTAIHAEERAILNAAGRNIKGTTIYTSTFPCFLCSEKIAHAGIAEVVFTEPYPDVLAAERLDVAGVTVKRFEGVRSSSFDRLFARARQDQEERIDRERAASA